MDDDILPQDFKMDLGIDIWYTCLQMDTRKG